MNTTMRHMESKQQTAVRKLINYITERGFDLEYEMEMSFLDIEKEQIIEHFINGSQYSIFPDNTPIDIIAEQYYNKLYGK